MGFDSEMHDPKSFRYLDLSKEIREWIKRAVEQVGLTCSTALSLIHHLIKRIAERLCRPTVHFVQANLRYLVRLSTKRMRMVATCARVALP